MSKPEMKDMKNMKGMKRPPMKKGVLGRLLKMLFADYTPQLIIVAICIVFSALANTSSSLFMNILVRYIEEGLLDGWNAVAAKIFTAVAVLIGIYVLGLFAQLIYNRLMAIVTQSFLNKTRKRMFSTMQKLPIKYFDTHHHGDIMSYYTNDTDTMRELISRCLPTLLMSGLIIAALVFYMFYLSIWMTLVVFVGVVAMFFVTKIVGGKSARYFIKQQKAVGKTEGFIEEMMNGQKVVKVFCH